MTKLEAQITHATSQLVLMAVKSNLDDPHHTNLAERYANWLNENGRTVQLEIVEQNGQRRVLTCTIDGKTWVRNGAFVNDPAAR